MLCNHCGEVLPEDPEGVSACCEQAEGEYVYEYWVQTGEWVEAPVAALNEELWRAGNGS